MTDTANNGHSELDFDAATHLTNRVHWNHNGSPYPERGLSYTEVHVPKIPRDTAVQASEEHLSF